MTPCVLRSNEPALPAFDVHRANRAMQAAFNPAHRDHAFTFRISGTAEGMTFVTFAFPEGLARSLVTLVESLGGVLRSLDMKSRAAHAVVAAHEPAAEIRAEKRASELADAAVKLYDGFQRQGLDAKTALSRTNQALKASDFPWTSYETTRTILRRSGRCKATAQTAMSGRPDTATERSVDL